MATKIRRMSPGGGNGSVNQKIVNTNRKLGVDGIGSQQGSTRVIYDMVQLAATSVNTTIQLFENCKTRQFPLTNLQENKLQVGESTAFQRYSFFILECASGTTNALGLKPLSFFAQFQRLYAAYFDFQIAQDTVVKKMPLSSMYSAFNKDSRFNAMYQLQPFGGDLVTDEVSHDVQWMDNDLIIPPQIEFRCNVLCPPIALPSGFDFYLGMKLEGLGSLFAPKTTY